MMHGKALFVEDAPMKSQPLTGPTDHAAPDITRRNFVNNTLGALTGCAVGVMFARPVHAQAAPTLVLINEARLRQQFPNEISSLLASARMFAERHNGALIDVGRHTTARAIKADLVKRPQRPARLVIFGDETGIPRFPIKARDVDLQIDSPYGDLDGDGLSEVVVCRVLGSPQSMIRLLGGAAPFGASPHAVYLADQDPQYRPEGNRFVSLIADHGCTLQAHRPGNAGLLRQADLIVLGAHGNPDGWYGELGTPFVTASTVPDLPRQPVVFAGACSTATPGAPILQKVLDKGCRAYVGAVSDAFGWTTGDLGNQLSMHFLDALAEHPEWTVAEMVSEARNRYVRATNLQSLILRLERGESADVDAVVTHTALQWQMFGDITAQFPRATPRSDYRRLPLAQRTRILNRGDSISVRYDVGDADGLPLLYLEGVWDRAASAGLQIEVTHGSTLLHRLDWQQQREWWAYTDTAVGGYSDRGRYHGFAVVPLVRRRGANEAVVRVSQTSKPVELLTGSAMQVWPQRTPPPAPAQHARQKGINLLWLAREGPGIVPRLTRGDTGPLRGAFTAIGGLRFDRRDDFGSMLAPYEFPDHTDQLTDLARYDVIVIDDMWNGYQRFPRGMGARVRDFVRQGGGLIMAGGPWSYSGMAGYRGHGQGGFGGTPVEEALPVRTAGDTDVVEGKTTVRVDGGDHPVTAGLEWQSLPPILGYNRVVAKPGAQVLARTASGDPFLVAWQHGKGRVIAVTTRSARDWGAEFTNWSHYRRFWRNVVRWVSPVADQPVGLAGTWCANDGGNYTITQSGSEITWEGVSGDGGKAWTHTFNGTLRDDTVSGKWTAHPPGASRGGGELSVSVLHPGRLAKVPGTGGGFGGSIWIANLSGVWRCNDGGTYTIRQSGLQIAWDAASGDAGKSWTHVFNGASRGDAISGKWMDNRTRGGGDLSVLMIDSKRLEKVPGTGEGFGGSVWTR
jgi:uncharacterized membrane protein